MSRVTQQDLQNILDRINAATGHNPNPYTLTESGQYRRNPGTYVLDYAYGAVCLSQLAEGGGERTITGRGTKRETKNAMLAFLAGIVTTSTK